VETKPLHASQMVLERDEDTGKVIFEIKVVLNVEFYAQILSFGPGVKILAPEAAVKTMRDMVRKMYVLYP
jgi:predicted DNA-binding transcriptional regulator YafY